MVMDKVCSIYYANRHNDVLRIKVVTRFTRHCFTDSLCLALNLFT